MTRCLVAAHSAEARGPAVDTPGRSHLSSFSYHRMVSQKLSRSSAYDRMLCLPYRFEFVTLTSSVEAVNRPLRKRPQNALWLLQDYACRRPSLAARKGDLHIMFTPEIQASAIHPGVSDHATGKRFRVISQIPSRKFSGALCVIRGMTSRKKCMN